MLVLFGVVKRLQTGESSMSTSLLYHGFGVRGYHLVKTEFAEGEIVFHVAQPFERCRCSACGSGKVAPKGHQPRRFRGLPIGGKPVILALPIPRVQCLECGLVRQVAVDFADVRRSYSKSFARYVLELSRLMTIKDVAHHLSISWDLVKEIQKQDLERRFSRPKLKHLKQIAIDEISIGKGHRYVTLVMDLESGAVVHVGEGKGGDALTSFWKRLRSSGAKVQAVATDMSPAYIEAVTTHLPKASLVFDRFHVMKLFNDKLSNLRRELYREATDMMHKEVLKGTRWLLLKRPENLDPQRNEPSRLEEALRLNEPLATAYYLKEDLAEVWEQEDQETAQAFLMDWIRQAEASGIRMLIQFAKTMRLHAWRILAWYDCPISTGPLEGTNNKIKTMKRQAYGFRDQEFFKLKIYAIHEARYALVG
jgi:transposase